MSSFLLLKTSPNSLQVSLATYCASIVAITKEFCSVHGVYIYMTEASNQFSHLARHKNELKSGFQKTMC